MRILLPAYGTEGDVRPFVALARGLQQRGHEVAVCTAEGFAPLVEGAGVPLLSFGNELYEATRRIMAQSGGLGSLVTQFKEVLPPLRQSLDRQWHLARDFDPDVIVTHPKPLAPLHIAEALDVPALLSVALPLYHPTTAFPSPALSGLPRPLWGLGWWLGRRATSPYRRMLNDFRGRIGLPPVPRGYDDRVTPDGSPRHVLYHYSSAVVPTPAEWPEQAHVTGSWFLDSEDHAPDAALAAFLDEGEPDLYIGFGSMALGRASHEWSAAVAGALRRTGARAVVATGWGGLDADALPPTALPVHHVPHDWLFPWVRALVHHGGSGTVAAGLRAGRPTLVCPVLGDQPFWGDRLHELGVGPRPLPVKKLTADVLAERIQELLGNPAHAEKAEHVGRALRAEDGVRVAAEVIETVARR